MEKPCCLGYPEEMTNPRPAVGSLLRQWRQHRRMSQLDLAGESNISTRHLSFLETGRAQPSREMLLRLAEQLDIPLRERNGLLVAAGYAPIFQERPLENPDLKAARRAIDLLLAGHEPYPALAIDRHWTLVASNRTVRLLLSGIEPSLLQPPINVLRLSLHPLGLAPRIANLAQWRSHLFTRLRRQIEMSADPALAQLLQELQNYPVPAHASPPAPWELGGIVIPFQLSTPHGILSFISTTTVFGTPMDITLSELALETFFPADAATAKALQQLASQE